MATIEIFVFLLGLIMGSFLNVVIFRLNTGLTLGGRSKCLSCGQILSWKELIPVLSFIIFSGKCRKCGSKISFQYILVEMVSGFLFLFFFLKTLAVFPTLEAFLSFFLLCSIWSFLLVIFVYDLRHKIIPNQFSILFIIFSFVYGLFLSNSESLFFHVIAGLSFSAFFFLLWYVSNGRWIGFGDVKLVSGIGFYLGLAGGLSALAFAFWIGAIVAISILITQKSKKLSLKRVPLTMKSEVPFAPFLIIGTFIAQVLGSDIFGLHIFFKI